MQKPKIIRRTFSEAQKEAFVSEWVESHQSAHAFGKARGIGAGNLIRWREQQEQGGPDQKPKMTFFPLQVLRESTEREAAKVVAKVLVGKLCVQVLAGAQKNDVQQLLAALQAVQS